MATILVIDDDEVSRLAVGSALEVNGHEVHYAPNGEVGLEVYDKSPCDVVIVDLAMPVMNGLRTIQELRENHRDVRIIAMSGVSPEQLPLAEEYGALRSMAKPVNPTEMQQAIDDVMRRSMGWEGID
jgi:DNA-binding response OmpR family regulator